MAPVDIDWKTLFTDLRSSDDGPAVCVASSPTPARGRAGEGRGKPKEDTPEGRRYQTRFGRMYGNSGAGAGGRRALLEPLDEDPKASDDIGRGARTPTAHDVYDFGPDDEEGESVSRRFCVKKSPVSSGKKNYCQLETSCGGRPRHAGFGKRKPLSVVQMYSSKPSSASVSAHQQRVQANDPEDVDYEDFQWSPNCSDSNYFCKRRKEKHQDSASHDTRKAEDVVLLDDDEKLGENVDCRTPDKQIESKIYYPSRDDPEAVELSGSDIKCLEPGVFLSSPVINYYIQYIKRTVPTEDKFYIFNTYFYSKLEEAFVRTNGFNKLRRWWKGVNIFHRAYIILPIHGMAHWSLIIICIPGKESDSGPIILHLDSLEMHSSTNIFGTVKRYLEEEWRYLKNNPPPDTSISESVWEDLPRNIHMQIVQVPQQNNAYDCGVFMLYYLERFVREAPERFTRDNLGMFSRSWFNSEDASKLRQRIQALLQEEFENARLDDAMSDEASSDGSDKEDTIKGGELEAFVSSDRSEMVIECVNSGDSGKNDEGLKVAATEEGSGESGGTGKSNVGIVDVPASGEVPIVSTRYDENIDVSARHDENVDCGLSEAATFSDSIKDEEDPVKAYSDSSKAEEEELAIVSPDKWNSHGGTSTPCPNIVCDSCDSDSDDVMIVEVPKRIATRKSCLFI